MTEEDMGSIMKKLDLVIIILLAKEGFSQKEIGKILGIGNKKIWEIFGNTFSKLQGDKK